MRKDKLLKPKGCIELTNNWKCSGALRPGSSTKMVIVVLDGNGSFSYFQNQHLDIASSSESATIIKF